MHKAYEDMRKYARAGFEFPAKKALLMEK